MEVQRATFNIQRCQLARRSAVQIPPHTAFRTSYPDNGFETKGPKMDVKVKELAIYLVEKARK